jgi:uncharacterized protein YjeT (DUF2065 family)
MNKYKIIGLIACLVLIFGFLSVTVFPSTFPLQQKTAFTGWTYQTPNTNFSFLGIALVIIGGVLLFYARYKYSAQEEKKLIEQMKKGE